MPQDGMEAPADSLQEQAERDDQGRFVKGRSGNPAGRETGSRNRATLLAETMFDGEAEALARKAIERALEGDAAALKMCLDRVLAPRRERRIEAELPPLEGIADIGTVMLGVLRAAVEGRITPSEAAKLAGTVEAAVKAIDASDFDRRLTALEEADAAYGAR